MSFRMLGKGSNRQDQWLQYRVPHQIYRVILLKQLLDKFLRIYVLVGNCQNGVDW